MAKKVKVVSCPLTADDATAVINAAIDGLQAEEEAAAVTATTTVSAAISEVDVKDMQGERALIVYTSTLTTTNVAVTGFTGAPDGATIVVKDSDNKVVKPQADGTYKLAAASYTYTATCTGYDTLTDQALTVSAADVTAKSKSVTVTMTETVPKSTVTFTASPGGASATTFVVKSGGTTTITAESAGVYKLAAGDYTYTATCTGYTTQTDVTLTVSAADVSTGTKTVTVTMVATGD